MVTTHRSWGPSALRLGLLAVAAVLAVGSPLRAQPIDGAVQEAVGGISINADGVLDNVDLDGHGDLIRVRARGLDKVPAAFGEATEMRKVSLRHLEAAVEEFTKTGKPLPQDIKFLGGLQQVRYVLVYPEQKDIVLVGPGEGWKVEPRRGYIVGVKSGRPVLQLDDLAVALRTAQQAAHGGITCSIDPTAEGLRQLQIYAKTLHTIGDPDTTKANIEQTLGRQRITFSGVPATSHFARVLVSADYHMKRLAMGFEKSPVPGLPNYLQMIDAGGTGMRPMAPRWWLEPKYDSLLRDAEGLSWELRGGSVKAMTEEDFLTANGDREHTGTASQAAKTWADNMTRNYDALALADPLFGQLRNCMELAIVGALIVKEDLPGKAGNSLPVLMDPGALKTDVYAEPKEIDSKASSLRKGQNWVISASGGVSIRSWTIVDQARKSDAPAAVRAKIAPAAAWCSN